VAATVSLAIGIWKEGIERGWIEGLSIYIAVVIIVGVTTFNDYAKEKQFQKLLASREDRYVQSIRGGEARNISIFKLLVGDVIPIAEGDMVPADCILI
jgi:P-type E1-E2 ATPase